MYEGYTRGVMFGDPVERWKIELIGRGKAVGMDITVRNLQNGKLLIAGTKDGKTTRTTVEGLQSTVEVLSELQKEIENGNTDNTADQ